MDILGKKLCKTLGWDMGLGGGSILPPFKDDLELDYASREDLTLTDTIAGEEAEIVGGYESVFNGSAKITFNELNIGSKFEVEYYAKYPDNTDTGAVFGSSNSDYTYFGRVLSNTFRVQIVNVSTQQTAFDWRGDGEWHKINIIVDTSCRLYIDDIEQPRNTSNIDGTLEAKIGVLGQFRSQDTSGGFVGVVSSVNINNQAIYHLNDHTYDSITGTEATNNSVTFQLNNSDQLQSTKDALNEGYYELSTGEKVINPQFALPVGATEYPADKLHNGIDSFVKINANAGDNPELVVNGDFATDSDWIKGDFWTIANNKLTSTASTDQTLQAYDFDIGVVYIVTYDIVDYVSGTVRVEIGSVNGYSRSSNGTYKQFLISDGSDNIKFDGLVAFTGSITNVSIKKIDSKFDILNRANTTIQTTASRDSVYYDSTQPFLYFVSTALNELDYDVMQTYLNTAYQDRVFLGLQTNYGSVLNSFRFFTYATVKTGDDLIDVLNYINYLEAYELLSGSDYQTTEGKYYVKYS